MTIERETENNKIEPKLSLQLEGVIREYFSQVTPKDPEFKALVDYLREIDLGLARYEHYQEREYKEDKFGRKEFNRESRELERAQSRLIEEIDYKERNRPGYIQSRRAITTILEYLGDLKMNEIFEEKGDDYIEAEREGNEMAWEFLSILKEEIIERSTDEKTRDLLKRAQVIHGIYVDSLQTGDEDDGNPE